MLKKTLLAIGCASSLGCGTPKLGITEVCFISPDVLRCYYTDGTSKEKSFAEADKYTAFSPANAQKLQTFADKCLRAGIRP